MEMRQEAVKGSHTLCLKSVGSVAAGVYLVRLLLFRLILFRLLLLLYVSIYMLVTVSIFMILGSAVKKTNKLKTKDQPI